MLRLPAVRRPYTVLLAAAAMLLTLLTAVALPGAPASAQQPPPTLDLTPDTVRAGQTVQATGCNYGAGVTVTIYWHDEQVMGRAVTDKSGCFDTAVTIPKSARTGFRQVFSSPGGAQFTVHVVRPRLDLAPDHATAGSTITVSGCGWLAERTMTLTWAPTGEQMASFRVTNGCFEHDAAIPAGAAPEAGDIEATQTFTDASTQQTYDLTETAAFTVDPLMFVASTFLVPVHLQPFQFKDLGVHDVEITEAIQCFDPGNGLAGCADNSLTMVHDKQAAARIYLSYHDPLDDTATRPDVPVRFYIRKKGDSSFQSVTVSGVAKPELDQLDEDVPYALFSTYGGGSFDVEYYVVVDPNNVIPESNESNNRFPATGVRTIRFHPTRDLTIDGQRTDYHPTGFTGDRTADGWALTGGGADWLEALLPVGNIDYSLLSGYLDWTTSVGGGSGQHALIKKLNQQWFRDQVWSFVWSGLFVSDVRVPDPDPDHLYGWVTGDGYGGGHADMPVYPHAGGYGVSAIGTDNVGSSPSIDSPGSGAYIFGHELVHDYDVKHTDTGGDDCGSDDSSSTFPYSTSSIQEVGFDPATGTVFDPAGTHDLMSYCPAGGSKLGWISPFTWQTMFSAVGTRQDNGVSLLRAPNDTSKQRTSASDTDASRAPRKTFQAAATSESVAVDLTIFAPGDAGQLDHVEILPSGIQSGETTSGQYALEVRDGAGAVLDRREFDIDFHGEYHTDGIPFPSDPGADFGDTDEASTSFVLPLAGGATKVVLLDGTTVLDQVAFSANAPTVGFTNPAGEVTWDAGSTQTVAWNGNDADGDSLTYSLYFRNSPGADFAPLVLDTASTSVDLPVDALAGGDQTQFRVVVADGTGRTGTDTSPFVAIPDKDPVVSLTAPADGWRIAENEAVTLRGVGTDLEDGELLDANHAWTSDLDGPLGTGKEVVVDDLSAGTHTITLTGTDSSGNTASDQMTLYVSSVDTLTADPEPAAEGADVVVSATFSDPSNSGPYTCTVDYGDGAGAQPGTVDGTTCRGAEYAYDFDGVYFPVVQVEDADGRVVGAASGQHEVSDVAGRDAYRQSGLDRFETAAAISGEQFDPGVSVAYVATGANFADALSGGPVAALTGGPILLTAGSSLPAATRAELERLRPGRIVVLGGSAAVPNEVEQELEGLTAGPVTRLSGLDRFETAAKASAATFPAGVRTVFVATGLDFADALAGGPSATLSGAPMLLVANSIPDSVDAELQRLSPQRIVVLGGPAAVPSSVLDELGAYVR